MDYSSVSIRFHAASRGIRESRAARLDWTALHRTALDSTGLNGRMQRETRLRELHCNCIDLRVASRPPDNSSRLVSQSQSQGVLHTSDQKARRPTEAQADSGAGGRDAEKPFGRIGSAQRGPRGEEMRGEDTRGSFEECRRIREAIARSTQRRREPRATHCVALIQ